ncbi:FAD-dependent oxidoreductase [Flaviaesturariibacter amylovorans]|uniref:FAD-dependent oxidoreductase n=1 Tax=Flaviaesturariibacter amylovorans TaxID=1084520 RepID=A0ABP8GYA3_9BACT
MFSIWEQESFLAPADVLIVGGGFAGLWSAWHLRRRYPKASIVVLERDLIPMGASTRNAGFACFGSAGELVADAKALGNDRMLELVELRYRGLQQIEKNLTAARIDLDWCGGYELFEEGVISSEELAGQLEVLNILLKPLTGARRTFRDVSHKIPRFGFGATTHLVRNKAEGSLHSGKLVRALQKSLQQNDVQLLHGVAAGAIHADASLVTVTTSAGFDLKARHVLLCNNTAARHLLPELQVTPARGQVLLTSPIEGLAWQGTFHADEGYYYFRNLGNRVLLGGARNKACEAETSDERVTTELIQGELERFLDSVVLPGRKGDYTIEHRWSGIMGMGTEKTPCVRTLDNRVHAAVALGGIGVAAAPEVGRRAARLIEL